MLNEACKLEWFICASEQDALLLERRWVKTYQPKFNIKLKEGQGYRGVFLASKGDFPAVRTWRKRDEEGSFFGPYPQINSFDLIDVIGRVHGLRSCSDKLFREKKIEGKPCLLGETDRCSAPCVGRIDADSYRDKVNSVKSLLLGRDRSVIDTIKDDMMRASSVQNFELAASRKSDYLLLSKLMEVQRSIPLRGRYDFLYIATLGDLIAVSIIRVLDGELVNIFTRTSFIDPNQSNEELHNHILGLLLYNNDISSMSNNITLVHDKGFLPSADILELYKCVKVAKRKGELIGVNLAKSNADEALSVVRTQSHSDANLREGLLESLGATLGINTPRRIECIDISHTQGVEAVGSLVVMIDGEMVRDQYRKIKVPRGIGGDDYASIYHVVSKRLSGAGLPVLPDLLVIDGGKGQLRAALAAISDSGNDALLETGELKVISLAKRLEEVFVYPEGSALLIGGVGVVTLLQQVRDEAHRYAVTNHRRYRERLLLKSAEIDIPGVSRSKMDILLSKFEKSHLPIATFDEIMAVEGIGKKTALRIIEYYAKQ